MSTWFWNLYGVVYDALPRHFRPYSLHVDQIAGLVSAHLGRANARILDAGCGTGNYLRRLASCGYQVVGLDTSPWMLARARGKAPTAELCQSNLEERLPFADEVFDCVMSINALYMLRAPERALVEFWRVLRPGGILVLSHPHRIPSLWSSWIENVRESGAVAALRSAGPVAALAVFNLAISRRCAQDRYQCWSYRQVKAALGAAGFRVQSIEPAYACRSNWLVSAVKTGELLTGID
jgi:SAM-dependent methyltransferase